MVSLFRFCGLFCFIPTCCFLVYNFRLLAYSNTVPALLSLSIPSVRVLPTSMALIELNFFSIRSAKALQVG